jgi:cytochrome P450
MMPKNARPPGLSGPRGRDIQVRYGSGNRDPRRFARADAFDPDRADARAHLAFGAGIHTRIGARLAREEMVTASALSWTG